MAAVSITTAESNGHTDKKQNDASSAVYKCICGTEWKGIAADKIYDGYAGINCDKCGKEVNDSAIAYHCANKQAQEHHEGYDVCEMCAREINQNNEVTSDNTITANLSTKSDTNIIDKNRMSIILTDELKQDKSLTQELNEDTDNIISAMTNEEITELKQTLKSPTNTISSDEDQYKEEKTINRARKSSMLCYHLSIRNLWIIYGCYLLQISYFVIYATQ